MATKYQEHGELCEQEMRSSANKKIWRGVKPTPLTMIGKLSTMPLTVVKYIGHEYEYEYDWIVWFVIYIGK